MGYPRQNTPAKGFNANRADVLEALEPRLMMARATGIDVSDWQGSIDWSQVASSGVQFAFIRATRGGTTGTYDEVAATGTLSERYDDTTFLTNVTEAKAAGLEVGVYHFARPDVATNTGADEAQHFLDVAGDYMGDGYLPPVLDLEAGSTLSRTALTDWATEFANTVFTAKGVFPIVYVNSNYANREVDSRLASLPLWMARPAGSVDPATGNPPAAAGLPNVYGVWNPSYPLVPSPQPWSFWQYGTATVSGIAGVVDQDVFNGTLSQLRNNFVVGYVPPTDPALALSVTLGTTTVLSGDTLDFGTATVNSPGPTMTFIVKNISDEPVLLSNLVSTTGFIVTDGLPAYLMPGFADTLVVRLDTSTAATSSGAVQFNLDGPVRNTFTINLNGEVDPIASGAITGVLYEDLNGSAVRDPGENGLAGWQLWADINCNGRQDWWEPVVTTSDAGQYTFNGLDAGVVQIHPIIPSGWTQTGPGGSDGVISIDVFPNTSTQARDLGMAQCGMVVGSVFQDDNDNQAYDPHEPFLKNMTIYIDRNRNGQLDDGEVTTKTNSAGVFQFELAPGQYIIRVDKDDSQYAHTIRSYYLVNVFSQADIEDIDFGLRVLCPPY